MKININYNLSNRKLKWELIVIKEIWRAKKANDKSKNLLF